MKLSVKTASIAGALAILGILAATAMIRTQAESSGVPVPEGYSRLVFADEFDTDGLPDSTRWNLEEGQLRNGEHQYYTRRGNAFCKNGKLRIELREESPADVDAERHITSASLTTAGLSAWEYGYIEVKARYNSSRGVWPAIRMLPAKDVYGSWPRSGEIDIMEHVGHRPGSVYFTTHCERFNNVRSTQRRAEASPEDTPDGFHIYALAWSADRLEWFVDGKSQYAVSRTDDDDWTSWPFDSEFFLTLNLAYGGSWGGEEGVDDSQLPRTFEIDYVRVFQ